MQVLAKRAVKEREWIVPVYEQRLWNSVFDLLYTLRELIFGLCAFERFNFFFREIDCLRDLNNRIKDLILVAFNNAAVIDKRAYPKPVDLTPSALEKKIFVASKQAN